MTNHCNVKHHYVKSNDKSNVKLLKYEDQSYLAEASGITGLFQKISTVGDFST